MLQQRMKPFRISKVLSMIAVLALKADTSVAPAPRTQPPPVLAAFSAAPPLKFRSARPHSYCSALPRPRWIRTALPRAGKPSGVMLLAVDAAAGADLGAAVEQAAARTRDVGVASRTIIDADSPLGVALGDTRTAAWFFEGQTSELRPGSKQRFLATLGVSSCITVFATSPDGQAFGAHVSSASLAIWYAGIQSRWKGGAFMEDFWRAMQDVFRGVDPSLVTINLVGGYTRMDLELSSGLKKIYPDEPSMWCFSGVMQRAVSEALPGDL